MTKIINLIVCHDLKKGISKNSIIPWNCPADFKFFKRVTNTTTNIGKKNALIMGSKTFDYFNKNNKLVQNRKIFVLTRDNSLKFNDSNIAYVNSIDKIIKDCNADKSIEQIFLCSNSTYQYSIKNDIIDKMYLSIINKDYHCDNFIDDYSKLNFSNRSIILEDSDLQICELFSDKNYLHNNFEEEQYLSLLLEILNKGEERQTRNYPVKSLFGKQLIFNLEKSFPLLTTKNIYFKGVLIELLELFLKGKTDTNILSNNKVNIWKENTTREFLDSRGLINYNIGEMGPMYGYQWRNFGLDYMTKTGIYVDQLKNVLELIINDHTSRRIMMTTYNPLVSNQCVLDPCHGIITQFYVSNDNEKYYLDCYTYQRSADMFLGVPFNIASYALLVNIICLLCRPNNKLLHPRNLIIGIGDAHIYSNHVSMIEKQIFRKPLPFPVLKIDNSLINTVDAVYGTSCQSSENIIKFIDSNIIQPKHFTIENYLSYDKLEAKMIP